jgi:hypothetical protein
MHERHRRGSSARVYVVPDVAEKSRIMYVESRRPDGRIKSGRIARVRFSKTGRTIYYDGRSFEGVGMGEYVDRESGESYWFSGPRQDGNDRKGNRPGSFPIEIDEDVRREYWTQIRGLPERATERVTYG